jgi:hypothetical protein
MRKFLFLAALALGLYAPASFAQSLTPGITGNECWNAGNGPGGPSAGFMCSYLLRNSEGYTVLGGSIGVTPFTNLVGSVNVNAQPSATTYVTPTNPFDGEVFQICNVTAAAWSTNVVTLTPATGSTINGGNITLTTLAANTCVQVQYQLSSTTWFRTR